VTDNVAFPTLQEAVNWHHGDANIPRLPRRHLFIRRHHTDRRAPAPEDPKHLRATSRIDVGKVIGFMTTEARQRMKELEVLSTTPNTMCRSQPRSPADNAVADQLLAMNFSRRVTKEDEAERPTVGWADMLEVAEAVNMIKSPTGWRARQIQWTRDSNEAVATAGYKAQLGSKYGLLVPAEYDSPIPTTPSATTRDLEISFFQLPVQRNAWATQRFRDRRGNLYELIVTSMGNTLSCERMTLVTLTLGFAPGFSEVVIPNTTIHGHVDNLRCAGQEGAQRQWQRAVATRAKIVGATFNDDGVDCAATYEFCGRAYDHRACTVAIAEKTRSKMVESPFSSSMSFAEWERAWSRLIHCAQIVDTDWTSPSKWFAMFYARRILALASYGVIREHDAVRVPAEVWTMWQEWHHSVAKNQPRTIMTKTATFRFLFFVDATLKSYGGVLVDLLTNTVHSFGAAFSQPHTNINAAETQAIDLGLDAFALPRDEPVAIIVDNSSSEAGARNLKSRSFAVNEVLDPLARKHLRGRQTAIFRIGTAVMPADEPSRLKPVNDLKVRLATQLVVAKGRGEGASFVRTVDPA
jgi:hypothetical protein